MKRGFVFIALLLSLLLSSCTAKTLRSITAKDYKEYVDQIAQDLAHSLERKDERLMRARLSQSMLHDREQMDMLSEYIESFQGTVLSVEGNYSGYGHQDGQIKTLDLDCYYDITTDCGVYELYFTVTVVDDTSEDNIGVRSVEIVSSS